MPILTSVPIRTSLQVCLLLFATEILSANFIKFFDYHNLDPIEWADCGFESTETENEETVDDDFLHLFLSSKFCHSDGLLAFGENYDALPSSHFDTLTPPPEQG